MNDHKPSALVRQFAASLGWHCLEQTTVTMTEDICSDLAPGTVLTFWSTSDLKFFIQINQKITGQFGEYNVAVVAERYDIGPMDYESCRFKTPDEADNEAQRLSPLFARSNFRDRRWQRQYLEQYPQKLWRQKKKWRGWKRQVAAGLGGAEKR